MQTPPAGPFEPSPCDLLIAGGVTLTLDRESRILSDGAIAITGSLIVDVGERSRVEARWRPTRRLSGRDRLVMPGLVNVHNHSPLMITRGMVEDLGYAPMYTPGIPQGHRLSAEEAWLLSLLGVYELVRTGSTTIVDYYRYPEVLARAHATLGSRAVIGGRIHDADPEALSAGRYEHRSEIGRASLEENARLIQDWNGHDRGRIRCDWAPHAVDTCSRGLLSEVAKLAATHDGNLHTHLAQSAAEVSQVKARSALTPAQLLESIGLLDSRLIAAHCIHLDTDDIDRCGRAGITVAHSPIGNAKSGTIAPILDLEQAGARIALCTDTMAGDMVEAMRWAVSMQRIRASGAMVLDAKRAIGWATQSGASALGLDGSIGALEVGRKADILLIDTRSPSMAPVIDGTGVLVYSASGKDVDTVIIDGRIVIEAGQLATADGPDLVREAQRCAERLWSLSGTVPVTWPGGSC